MPHWSKFVSSEPSRNALGTHRGLPPLLSTRRSSRGTLSFSTLSNPCLRFLYTSPSSRERELPLLSPFFIPLYRVKRKKRRGGGEVYWDVPPVVLAGPPPPSLPPPRYHRASTSTSASLRSNDEDSAASAKSFEEVSRRLYRGCIAIRGIAVGGREKKEAKESQSLSPTENRLVF